MTWPTTEPTLPPSKLRLLVMRTDEGYSFRNRYLLANLCSYWPVWTITYVVYLHVGNIFRLNIYLQIVHLSRYEVIILERHLVARSDRSVGCNQTFSLVKTSALSLVLVRVYWRDDKGSPLVCDRYWSGLLAIWRKSTFGMSLGRWRRANTSKLLLRQSCG